LSVKYRRRKGEFREELELIRHRARVVKSEIHLDVSNNCQHPILHPNLLNMILG
jgi:hypothetical protein